MEEQFKTALEAALTDFRKGVMTKDEVEAQIKSVQENLVKIDNSKDVAEIKAAVCKLETAIKEVKNTVATPSRSKSIIDFAELLAEKIKSAGNKFKSEFQHRVKAVGNETLSGSVTVPSASPVLSTLVDADVFQTNLSTGDDVLTQVTVGATDKATIVWVDQTGGEGSVSTTNEAAAKNQLDVDFTEKVSTASKYTAYVKVSDEMLSDTPFIASAVQEVMVNKVAAKVRNAVVAKLNSEATTFSLTDFNGSVESASLMDAINCAIVQSEQSGFTPAAIVLNPVDLGKLRLIKSTSGVPVVQWYNEGKMPVLANSLVIIKSTDQTAGTFVLGDFSRLHVDFYQQAVEMGLDSDDFTKNMHTLRAEERLHLRVSSCEKTSFVKGTFATIITAIGKAASEASE